MNLLVISEETLPPEWEAPFQKEGFAVHKVRGQLALKKSLEDQSFRTAIWFWGPKSLSLFSDLSKLLKDYQTPFAFVVSDPRHSLPKELKKRYPLFFQPEDCVDWLKGGKIKGQDASARIKLPKAKRFFQNELSFRSLLRFPKSLKAAQKAKFTTSKDTFLTKEERSLLLKNYDDLVQQDFSTATPQREAEKPPLETGFFSRWWRRKKSS